MCKLLAGQGNWFGFQPQAIIKCYRQSEGALIRDMHLVKCYDRITKFQISAESKTFPAPMPNGSWDENLGCHHIWQSYDTNHATG